MIIIAGHLLVPAADRDRMVEVMQDPVRRGLQVDGCLDLAITADSQDPRRVQNLEVWRVAEAPEPGVEVLADHVTRYDAVDGGPMFG